MEDLEALCVPQMWEAHFHQGYQQGSDNRLLKKLFGIRSLWCDDCGIKFKRFVHCRNHSQKHSD